MSHSRPRGGDLKILTRGWVCMKGARVTPRWRGGVSFWRKGRSQRCSEMLGGACLRGPHVDEHGT